MKNGEINHFLIVLYRALNGIIESMVSLKRLSEFIKLDKIDLANYYCSPEELEVGHDDEDVIIIEDATFSHTSDLIVPDDQQAFKLDHINVVVKKGELVGIVGKVGSGKSSLLNCVMVSTLKKELLKRVVMTVCLYYI